MCLTQPMPTLSLTSLVLQPYKYAGYPMLFITIKVKSPSDHELSFWIGIASNCYLQTLFPFFSPPPLPPLPHCAIHINIPLCAQRETDDENLFSSSVAMLANACELAYHTVACSVLNAEEMRREGGIEVCWRENMREHVVYVYYLHGMVSPYAIKAHFLFASTDSVACSYPMRVRDQP